jgi:CAAX protease family protein
MEAATHQRPPMPPELPEGAEPRPRWPAWYSIAGFFSGLLVATVVIGILSVPFGVDTSKDQTATFTAVGTFVQDAILVGTAVLFASFQLRPRAWHFGLRRTNFWTAVGWAALGMFSFYVVAAVYGAAVQPKVDQGITQSLGANQSTLGLIVAGVMVMVVAPVAEEIFFRGFVYGALRTKFSVLVAAGLDALLFGIIHFDFKSAHDLLIIPPLALLGFIFCLIYERTGSLFPTIALHSINNALAYAVQTDPDPGWRVSLVVAPLMLAACALAPRYIPAGPRPLPATR